MLAEVQVKKDEFAGHLRQGGAEAAFMRQKISDLDEIKQERDR